MIPAERRQYETALAEVVAAAREVFDLWQELETLKGQRADSRDVDAARVVFLRAKERLAEKKRVANTLAALCNERLPFPADGGGN